MDGDQDTDRGWNPWLVILIFAVLQAAIFCLLWYLIGSFYLNCP
jgi:hypothetical protein